MSDEGFTKEFHRAKIGTMEPALCGELPPGRPWRAAPKDGTAAALPPCESCRAKHEAAIALGEMWLAS